MRKIALVFSMFILFIAADQANADTTFKKRRSYHSVTGRNSRARMHLDQKRRHEKQVRDVQRMQADFDKQHPDY